MENEIVLENTYTNIEENYIVTNYTINNSINLLTFVVVVLFLYLFILSLLRVRR